MASWPPLSATGAGSHVAHSHSAWLDSSPAAPTTWTTGIEPARGQGSNRRPIVCAGRLRAPYIPEPSAPPPFSSVLLRCPWGRRDRFLSPFTRPAHTTRSTCLPVDDSPRTPPPPLLTVPPCQPVPDEFDRLIHGTPLLPRHRLSLLPDTLHHVNHVIGLYQGADTLP